MPSVASSSVTPIRARVEATPAAQLGALVADPGSGAEAFDDVADAHPAVSALARVLAALRRIAHDRRDGTADTQLARVAEDGADDEAVAVAHQLPVTAHARTAVVAVASAAGHDSDVLALTHGVDAVDDVTALQLAYRATALTRLGLAASAGETLERVLRSRRRHPAVRAFARRQRNRTWLAEPME